jgi:bis(5'-nucleosidyl)-tetraphosphatase
MTEESFGIIPVKKDCGHLKFLLIQHRGGHWAFPKGHADQGETDVQTALREFREETGLPGCEIRPEVSFVDSYEVTGEDGTDHPKTVKYFLGWVTEGKVQIDAEEIQDYAWLNFKDALERISFDGCRSILEDLKGQLDRG